MADYNTKLHQELLTVGKKLERGTTHKLEPPFIETLLATLDYFQANQTQLSQAHWDLNVAKYKIFDWLGMCYTGRLDAEKGSQVFDCIENMVKLYVLQNHIGGFAWFLRGHDLDIEKVKRCEDCIKSYEDWKKEGGDL